MNKRLFKSYPLTIWTPNHIHGSELEAPLVILAETADDRLNNAERVHVDVLGETVSRSRILLRFRFGEKEADLLHTLANPGFRKAPLVDQFEQFRADFGICGCSLVIVCAVLLRVRYSPLQCFDEPSIRNARKGLDDRDKRARFIVVGHIPDLEVESGIHFWRH